MDDRFQSDAEYGRVGREDVGESRPPALHAPSESAHAAIALGAVFAVMGFPALLMIHALDISHFGGWPRGLIVVAAVLGLLGGLFVLACSVIGLVFGIFGIGTARRGGRPIALALAGVMLNILDLLVWLGALIAWIAVVAGRL